MSIASAISNAQQRVADAYTAISNKGGTLPATQNLTNMPTAINSIPSGSGGYTELPSYQVVNGVASKRSIALTGNEFNNITSIDDNGLYNAFNRCTGLTGTLDLSSLITVGSNGLSYAFYGCTGLISVNLSALTTVGISGLNNAFYGCTGITSVILSALTTVDSSGFSYAFYGCTGITDIYFNSLTTTSFGDYANQFNNMLYGTGGSVTHTLHFPSNLESTIQGLRGYPNFGGTSGYVVLSFDLPATS